MRIQVLGVGGAFNPEIGNSSIIIWDDNGGFLIDCGYTVYPILKEKNLIDKINRIFITHRHGDHIGSLDIFLYHKRFMYSQKVEFFGVTEHLEYLKQIDPSFDKDFDQYFEGSKSKSVVTLPVIHSEGVPSEAFYNFGILYSGDSSESLLDTPQAQEAKVILHEVTFNKITVHTDFVALARASETIKQKTWLYHYNVGEDKKFESKVRMHGFAGFLKKDQVIEIK